MKLKKLLNQYKQIAAEIKIKADRYNTLSAAINQRIAKDKDYTEYRKIWLEMISLSDRAYNIMLEYRTISSSTFYKVLFTLHLVRKQNSFRFTDSTHTYFKYDHFINSVNIK